MEKVQSFIPLLYQILLVWGFWVSFEPDQCIAFYQNLLGMLVFGQFFVLSSYPASYLVFLNEWLMTYHFSWLFQLLLQLPLLHKGQNQTEDSITSARVVVKLLRVSLLAQKIVCKSERISLMLACGLVLLFFKLSYNFVRRSHKQARLTYLLHLRKVLDSLFRSVI